MTPDCRPFGLPFPVTPVSSGMHRSGPATTLTCWDTLKYNIA